MTTELVNSQGYDYSVQENTLKSKIADLENSLATIIRTLHTNGLRTLHTNWSCEL